MLSYFPTPYPDEDFRSIIYRYHVHSHNTNFSTTNVELFGVRTDRNPHMPRNMQVFLAKTDLDEDILDFLLRRHTLWPLINPFLTDSQRDESIREITEGVDGARNFAGKHLSRSMGVLSKRVFYCPCCLEEDYDRCGECYVHRAHQIRPIDICHRHKVHLTPICPHCGVPLTNQLANNLLTRPFCINGHHIGLGVDASKPVHIELKLGYFNDCREIMAAAPTIGRSYITLRFQEHLRSRGYATSSGRIMKKEFFRDFDEYIFQNHLYAYGVPISSKMSSWWQRNTFTKGWSLQPVIVYTSMMRFLADSVKEFISGDVSASGYVSSTETYACDFDYSKGLPSSINERAAEEVASGLAEVASTGPADIELTKYRNRILGLFGENPDWGRKEFRRADNSAYLWLYKYDREWVEGKFPPKRKGGLSSDCEHFDGHLASVIEVVAARVYLSNPRNRIVKTMIMREIESKYRTCLFNHIDKLPKARKVLFECEEPRDDYLIRRIPDIVKQLLRSGYTNVTIQSILAFRRSYRGCSRHVRREIVSVLQNMGFHDVERGIDRYLEPHANEK